MTTEFWVHCGECKHEWIGAHLPMTVDKFSAVAKRAICPKCAATGRKIICGKCPALGTATQLSAKVVKP